MGIDLLNHESIIISVIGNYLVRKKSFLKGFKIMKKQLTQKEKEMLNTKRRVRVARAVAFIYRCKIAKKQNGSLTAEQVAQLCDYIKQGLCTKHNDKMEGLISLSTAAICNEYCKKRACNKDCICAHCYANNMLSMYKDLAVKNTINAHILTNIELAADSVPFINACIFRFESFGDLINELQFKNYCTIARKNQNCTFTIWTKNAFIIRRAFEIYGNIKPKNMIIIFSSPFLNTPAESMTEKYPWIDKVFTVYSLDYMRAQGMSVKAIDKFINCGAKSCAGCQKCYNKKNRTTFINEMLKSDQTRFEKMKKAGGLK